MVSNAAIPPPAEPRHIGLRCSAEEFLALPDDGYRYQLINGVVIMSPRPTPRHQRILKAILKQLDPAAEAAGGEVFQEVDVRLAPDLVYAPDLIYIGPGRAFSADAAISIVPDLILEVIPPSSRSMDLRTKRADFARFGVREYWVVEPESKRMRCFRPVAGSDAETMHDGAMAPSQVLAGFAFDLAAIRAAIEA